MTGSHDRLLATIADDPFGELLGITHELVAEGHVRSRATLRPEHRNPFGDGHGALAFALADMGMGRALVSALPAGARCATQSATIQYLERADGKTLTAESTLVHLGERTAATRSEVARDDGTVCAVAAATFYVSRPRSEP